MANWETNSVNKMLDWTFAAMDRSQQPAKQDYAEHMLEEYRRELQQLHAQDELESDELFSDEALNELDELEDYLAGAPEIEPRQSDLERRGHVR